MNIKKHIPNLFTLGNLFCGTIAIIFALEGRYEIAAYLVLLGIVFDFFDGFLARALHVSGELGKQLDSLADMVTSGVVPGIIMYKLFDFSLGDVEVGEYVLFSNEKTYIVYFAFILTLAACYRLAKFNIDTRQSESFIGLPTPAMSLFVVSLPLIFQTTAIEFVRDLISNVYFLTTVTLVFSYLMNAEIPLFSLKFKNYGLKENVFKYVLIVLSVILLITIQYLAIPITISVYVLLSMIKNKMSKK
ncbi:MAG: CDP-alcohol phosphatidyltransferase family protein [Flavobacteriaceae bacterium]|nr:CDP-alcohol phosphatidyltransferase family protein [Flavobacteriaceae bacterium]